MPVTSAPHHSTNVDRTGQEPLISHRIGRGSPKRKRGSDIGLLSVPRLRFGLPARQGPPEEVWASATITVVPVGFV